MPLATEGGLSIGVEKAAGLLALELAKENVDADQQVLVETPTAADRMDHFIPVACHERVEGERVPRMQIFERCELSGVAAHELAQATRKVSRLQLLGCSSTTL